MYNSVIDHMLEYCGSDPCGYLVVATHNEKGALHAGKRILGMGKPENVVFGQIYGMAEQISMPLGKQLVPCTDFVRYIKSL